VARNAEDLFYCLFARFIITMVPVEGLPEFHRDDMQINGPAKGKSLPKQTDLLLSAKTRASEGETGENLDFFASDGTIAIFKLYGQTGGLAPRYIS